MDFVITSFEWGHSQCKFHIWLFDFYLFFSTLRKDIYLINRMNLIENGKINAYNLHKQINWKVNCSCWKRHVLLLFFSLETMWFHFFLICNLSLNSPDCELHQLFTQQLQMQLNEIETEKNHPYEHFHWWSQVWNAIRRKNVSMKSNQYTPSNVLYRCQQAIFTYIRFAYGVCIEILTSKQQKNFIWIKSVHKLKTYQPIRGKKAE